MRQGRKCFVTTVEVRMDRILSTQNPLFSKLNGEFTKFGFGQPILSGSMTTEKSCLDKDFIYITAVNLDDFMKYLKHAVD